jgi:Matrixin
MFPVPDSRFVFWFGFAVRRLWFVVSLVALLSAFHLGAPFAPSEPRFRLVPLEASGVIPYFIDEGVDGSGFRRGDQALAMWALEEWARSTDRALRFERAARPDAALLRFSWLPWAEDGALGRMDPMLVEGHDGASISIRPDERRFRPSIRRGVLEDPLLRDVVLYYICLHEIGHALGLSHSNNPRDVMWPGNNGVTLPVYQRYRHRLQTRADIPRSSWLSDGDLARFKEIWFRVP